MSLDGYICDEAGGFDWILGQDDRTIDTENKFDFDAFLDSVDTIVMGSLAYEDCILSGLESFDNHHKIVATTRQLTPFKNTDFISGDIVSQIKDLSREEGKDIWLFGGSGLTDHFVKADAIDQYIIAIIPTILGKGRRLFNSNYEKIDLHLDQVNLDDGITILTYTKR
jgi:dihydrofolate reductase